jgi:hypothetical protein
MESTGQGNTIQVSQKTADQLISYGQEHWLTTLPDLVKAKDKGNVQASRILHVEMDLCFDKAHTVGIHKSRSGAYGMTSNQRIIVHYT